MTLLDANAVLLQVLLPLSLLTWLVMAPAVSRIGYVLQVFTTGLAMIALALTMVWLVPPVWVSGIYIVTFVLICGLHLYRQYWPARLWPTSVTAWCVAALHAGLGGFAVLLVGQSISGWTPRADVAVIDLPFMLGPGTYQIANGGSHEVINAHMMTLQPTTDRQRAYRGQSYAVDLVKIGPWGMRASGWRPSDPAQYAIFGEPVSAPCDGVVIKSLGTMPDMPVPQPDRSLLEGNHVLLDCGGYGVLFAHLRQGSVNVERGDIVALGASLGEVGNSGQTFEPHLHVHVQALSGLEAGSKTGVGNPISAQPYQLTLDGLFPLRNAWVRHRPGD